MGLFGLGKKKKKEETSATPKPVPQPDDKNQWENVLNKSEDEKTAEELFECAVRIYSDDDKRAYYKEESLERELELLELAEKKGHKEARAKAIEYLTIYANTAGSYKEYERKADYELRGAKMGDATLQFRSGFNYFIGWGVRKDKKAAFQWLKKAEEQGSQDVSYFLGMLYLEGTVVEKDEKKAFELFKKEAEMEEHETEGHTEAQCQLGLMYLNGTAVEKDVEKGLYWLNTAAKDDDDEAFYQLGRLYYEGKIVEKDCDKAFDYMEHAAHNGNVEGAYYLGMFYENGIGTDKSIHDAYEYYKQAAECKHKEAWEKMRELEDKRYSAD